MSETTITISVPTELNNLGSLTQSVVADLSSGKSFMAVLGSALPVLFAEGSKWEDLKAEIQDPQAIVLAGLVLGGIVAKLLEKKSAAVSAPAIQE